MLQPIMSRHGPAWSKLRAGEEMTELFEGDVSYCRATLIRRPITS